MKQGAIEGFFGKLREIKKNYSEAKNKAGEIFNKSKDAVSTTWNKMADKARAEFVQDKQDVSNDWHESMAWIHGIKEDLAENAADVFNRLSTTLKEAAQKAAESRRKETALRSSTLVEAKAWMAMNTATYE